MTHAAPARATTAGTRAYASRIADAAHDYFRDVRDLRLSSIGIGTYLGAPDAVTDDGYDAALRQAIALGCNVIDTAPNYRCGRSEQTIGRVVADLCARGTVARDAICISTKVGFMPAPAGARSAARRQLAHAALVDAGLASADEIWQEHLLSPGYIAYQLERSLHALQLSSIDVYYLHNPDVQRGRLDESAFYDLMRACFTELEAQADAGRIGIYGVSTATGFSGEDGLPALDLRRLVDIARAVGGARHRFGAVQLFVSLVHPEAACPDTRDGAGPLLAIAAELGLAVFASAPLHHGALVRLPAECEQAIGGLRTDAQRALQFARSLPGVTAALVGMRSVEHVSQNLELRRHARMNSHECGVLVS